MPTQIVQMTIQFSRGGRLLVVSDSWARAREFWLLGPDFLVTNKEKGCIQQGVVLDR